MSSFRYKRAVAVTAVCRKTDSWRLGSGDGGREKFGGKGRGAPPPPFFASFSDSLFPFSLSLSLSVGGGLGRCCKATGCANTHTTPPPPLARSLSVPGVSLSLLRRALDRLATKERETPHTHTTHNTHSVRAPFFPNTRTHTP